MGLAFVQEPKLVTLHYKAYQLSILRAQPTVRQLFSSTSRVSQSGSISLIGSNHLLWYEHLWYLLDHPDSCGEPNKNTATIRCNKVFHCFNMLFFKLVYTGKRIAFIGEPQCRFDWNPQLAHKLWMMRFCQGWLVALGFSGPLQWANSHQRP